MLFVVAIWAVRYAVKSNQFEDLDNASQRIILDDRQERRQTIQAHEHSMPVSQNDATTATDIIADDKAIHPDDIKSVTQSDPDKHPKI